MSFKSNLGQNGGGPSGGGPSGGGAPGGPSGAGPANQGGFTGLMPGMFPVGAPIAGICPTGYLPAPSATVPGGYTCIRAPGSYTTPIYMSGRR